MRLFVKRKSAFSYKNQHGHAYLVGGSRGKSGAVLLAIGAALRSGVGLVTGIVPQDCYIPLQSFAPEAMCQVSGQDSIAEIVEYIAATAIGLGVGMGTSANTVHAFAQFVESCVKPCVFDADALSIFSQTSRIDE